VGIMRAGAIQVNVNPLYTRANSSNQPGRRRQVSSSQRRVATLAEIIGNSGVAEVITVGLGDGTKQRCQARRWMPGFRTP